MNLITDYFIIQEWARYRDRQRLRELEKQENQKKQRINDKESWPKKREQRIRAPKNKEFKKCKNITFFHDFLLRALKSRFEARFGIYAKNAAERDGYRPLRTKLGQVTDIPYFR